MKGMTADLIVFDDLQNTINMPVHVFYYKFPRIQEGLVHEEAPSWTNAPRFVICPIGAYMFTQGRWYKRRHSYVNMVDSVVEVMTEKVPKEMRALLLLIN